jgi:hypothetical protein
MVADHLIKIMTRTTEASAHFVNLIHWLRSRNAYACKGEASRYCNADGGSATWSEWKFAIRRRLQILLSTSTCRG